jgi:hypothetical protein
MSTLDDPNPVTPSVAAPAAAQPPPPPPPETPANTSAKDSCTFALDLIKQFLTFSAAGIAFVLGIVSSGKSAAFTPFYVSWSVGLLVASVACGLLSFMCIVGNVKDHQSYDIDDAWVKGLTMFQILIFCAGVAVLFFPTLQTARAQQVAPSGAASPTPTPAPTPMHP